VPLHVVRVSCFVCDITWSILRQPFVIWVSTLKPIYTDAHKLKTAAGSTSVSAVHHHKSQIVSQVSYTTHTVSCRTWPGQSCVNSSLSVRDLLWCRFIRTHTTCRAYWKRRRRDLLLCDSCGQYVGACRWPPTKHWSSHLSAGLRQCDTGGLPDC